MLVCQCNIISDREIRQVIRALLADDPWQIIVPAKVYRELDKRCKCAGCVPNVIDLITAVTAEYHREIEAIPPAESAPASAALGRRLPGGRHRERRTAGHRAAQRGAVS